VLRRNATGFYPKGSAKVASEESVAKPLLGLQERPASPISYSRNWEASTVAESEVAGASQKSGEALAYFHVEPEYAEFSADAAAEKSSQRWFIKEYSDRSLRTEGAVGENINWAATRLRIWNEERTRRTSVEGDSEDKSKWFCFSISEVLALGQIQILDSAKEGPTEPLKLKKQDFRSVAFRFVEGMSLQHELTPPTSSFEILNFAYGLCIALQKLHNQGIAHSYIAPRNLVRGKPGDDSELTIVGFGYARIPDHASRLQNNHEPEEDEYFRAPECRRQSGGPFWYPADVYSVGAVLVDWILGREAARKLLNTLPRDVRALKGALSHALLAANPDPERNPEKILENQNILKILDSCLRHDVDDRITSMEDLLDMIRTARHVDPHHHSRRENRSQPGANVQKPSSEMSSDVQPSGFSVNPSGEIAPYLESFAAQVLSTESPFRRHFGSELVNRMRHEMASLESRHLEVFGSRDRIIASLCNLLGSARPGDEYCTLTLPDYWSDDNLGSNGRFLTMNKHVTTGGIRVKRVYLVDRTFHELSDQEQYILEQQLWTSPKPDNWDVRVRMVGASELETFEEVGSTVAFLKRTIQLRPSEEGTEYISLNFFSTAEIHLESGVKHVRRRIRKVRYWDARKPADQPKAVDTAKWARFMKHKNRFEQAFANSLPIAEYVLGPELEPNAPGAVGINHPQGGSGRTRPDPVFTQGDLRRLLDARSGGGAADL
jgi:serine/threonine protein kinase